MSEYEFTQEENIVFEGLSKNMSRFGIAIALVGATRFIAGAVYIPSWGFGTRTITAMLMGIFLIVVGIVIFRPSDNLKNEIGVKYNKDISYCKIYSII